MLKEDFKVIDIVDLMDADIPDIEYLIEDIIMRGGLTYFVGQSGSFKTGILMKAVLCGATKDSFLNIPIKNSFKTLWIDEENGQVILRTKVLQTVKGHPAASKEALKGKTFFTIIAGFQFHGAYVELLKKIINENKIDLVVIDSIARTIVGSERDESDVNKILAMIKPLMEEGVAFAIIHHTRKGSEGTLDDIAGSRDFAAMADYVYMISFNHTTSTGKQFQFKCVKSRVTEGSLDINFHVAGTQDKLDITYVGTTKEAVQSANQSKQSKCTSAILEYIKAHPTIRKYHSTSIVTQFKPQFSESLIRRSIPDLVEAGILTKQNGGIYVVK